MNMRQLERFVVLAETLNFRRAAEKLHMSQPPLSISIQKLESDLGVQLLTRAKNGVSLTKSGEAALVYAKRALENVREFKQAAQFSAIGERGTLRLGFIGSAIYRVLPHLLTSFREQYPGVQLVLKEATSIRIMQDLQQGVIDVGLVRIPVSTSHNAELMSLQTEHFVLAVPVSHRLAAQDNIKLSMLSDEGFILYSSSYATGLRMAVIHACQVNGFTPRIAQEAVQVQTILSLVEAGLGIALVPSLTRTQHTDKVVFKPLSDFPNSASVGISLAWQAGSETALINNIKRVAQNLIKQY